MSLHFGGGNLKKKYFRTLTGRFPGIGTAYQFFQKTVDGVLTTSGTLTRKFHTFRTVTGRFPGIGTAQQYLFSGISRLTSNLYVSFKQFFQKPASGNLSLGAGLLTGAVFHPWMAFLRLSGSLSYFLHGRLLGNLRFTGSLTFGFWKQKLLQGILRQSGQLSRLAITHRTIEGVHGVLSGLLQYSKLAYYQRLISGTFAYGATLARKVHQLRTIEGLIGKLSGALLASYHPYTGSNFYQKMLTARFRLGGILSLAGHYLKYVRQPKSTVRFSGVLTFDSSSELQEILYFGTIP